MFDIPLSKIDFDQVVQFCRTFPEGVRVEYKETPVHIPKIISSFANTVGGIWVIGVKTDPVTNRAVLPIVGMPRSPGVEEQIIQSAQTGIYPAITPAVRAFDVPAQSDRVVVVVKVPESIEAPHAIENSTRVYVRVLSTTPPYDLADIDRIEYLLRRRQEPERRREELIGQAAARSFYDRSRVRTRIVVAPVYPRGILIPLDTLYDRASAMEAPSFGMGYLQGLRRIHGAIMSSKHTAPRINHHFEMDTHGIAFCETEPNILKIQVLGNHFQCVHLIHLLRPVATVLNHVLPLLRGALTNILIRYELFGWNGISFLPEFREELPEVLRKEAAERHQCINTQIAASAVVVLETLAERRVEVLTEIIQQVLWAFDYSDPQLGMWVYSTLQDAHLI